MGFPFKTGDPPEGPKSALVSLTIPAGQTSATLATNLAQYGLSMVQSVLADNVFSPTGITVQSRSPDGVQYKIQSGGTTIFPVFTAANTLYLQVTLDAAQASPVTIPFQIFNSWVPPASFFSTLNVAGNVNIVSGTVSVSGSTVTISGLTAVSIMAAATGGATPKFIQSLSNTPTSVKNSAAGSLKGLSIDNSGASAPVYIQIFDIALPSSVTLGTTPPKLSYVCPSTGLANNNVSLPPEGVAFANGIQVAATTTPNGSTAPATSPNVNIIFA